MLAGFPNRSWQSLAAVYKAKGGRLFDVAAVHGYTSSSANVVRLVEANREVMAGNHDARKPIAVTEMGFSSAPSSVNVPKYVTWNTTPSGQAKKVTELYTALAAKRSSLRIAVDPPAGGGAVAMMPDRRRFGGLARRRHLRLPQLGFGLARAAAVGGRILRQWSKRIVDDEAEPPPLMGALAIVERPVALADLEDRHVRTALTQVRIGDLEQAAEQPLAHDRVLAREWIGDGDGHSAGESDGHGH